MKKVILTLLLILSLSNLAVNQAPLFADQEVACLQEDDNFEDIFDDFEHDSEFPFVTEDSSVSPETVSWFSDQIDQFGSLIARYSVGRYMLLKLKQMSDMLPTFGSNAH